MEEDTATEEDAAGDPEVEPRAAAPGPPTTAGSDRPLTGMSTGTINLPLFPSTPPNSAKDVYTRDEYIDAKLLHAKQLHFVSEMYQKRIDRLERRIQHLAGKHVRLRGTISKEVGGSARRQRRSFAGKIVTDLAASEGNPAQQVMLPSVMVPKPPPQQAERLRPKESYTPRAAYTNAKAGLTSREIHLLQNAAGTARSARKEAQLSTVNLFSKAS